MLQQFKVIADINEPGLRPRGCQIKKKTGINRKALLLADDVNVFTILDHLHVADRFPVRPLALERLLE
jgi:hypothetical protein